MPQSTNNILLLQQIQEKGGPWPGCRLPSKPALDGQQLHSSLLHSLVDAPYLLLGQGPFHVAVGDAVAMAGLVCPKE